MLHELKLAIIASLSLWVSVAASAPNEVLVGSSAANLDVAEQIRVCSDIPENGHRMVNLDGSTTTGLWSKYEITNIGQKLYRVDVNVDFFAGQTFNVRAEVAKVMGGARPPQIDAYYRERVKRCLREEINPMLFDSEGTRIELRINEKFRESTYTRAPPVEIRIQKAAFPDDRRNYSSDIDCTEIAHELLHILGLVDEYRSSVAADGSATGEVVAPPSEMDPPVTDLHMLYDCRAIGPVSSVMSSDESIQQTRKMVVTVCRCTSDSCKDNPSPDLSGAVRCPAGYTGDEPITVSPGQLPTIEAFYKKRGFSSVVVPQANPPLRPAHLRAIVFPGCQAKNDVYYRCAKSSMLTSSPTRACPVLPPECLDPEVWLK